LLAGLAKFSFMGDIGGVGGAAGGVGGVGGLGGFGVDDTILLLSSTR
jgi:hypothetical protein